ncbi:helix-hairpin-helix domain-containing protein [Actinomadura sp. KC345]|uniref:ComEA family DNA-binding protein n=1 Tax=Actinomadura sp. KC345 TaxID=2530371 RepID=UPI0010439CFC|nr:helix-hairpin-helix domain-containing protein [Actinomadura sp. KC345]TDC44735.1 helix-hairpin-helix domain-containing protein [Actinomadura sp. KC345]
MEKFGPGRTIGSYIWALSPIYTLGMGTSITMFIAAVRLRSVLLWLVQPIYLALVILGFVTAGAEDGTTGDALFAASFLTLVTVGTGHALAIRRKVFSPRETLMDSLALAEGEAQRRRELRVRAAEMASRDPALAVEMGIGRPDLQRSFDDGGLIDVNHAPAPALSGIPGITPELADRIVRVRADTGGFVSAEEVSLMADLPPALTPRIAEYGVFLR